MGREPFFFFLNCDAFDRWASLLIFPFSLSSASLHRRRSPWDSTPVLPRACASLSMIKFVLLVNKQGQTRLSRYAVGARPPPALRAAFEGEVVRKCLTRSDKQVRGKWLFLL